MPEGGPTVVLLGLLLIFAGLAVELAAAAQLVRLSGLLNDRGGRSLWPVAARAVALGLLGLGLIRAAALVFPT